ncbi:MAG: tRNA (adenosine(37)-N6)-dimethylallyltransferase MiaA [Pigmentiphaga sp.]|nr:tRNA (adenosine(37)-N6)-dimethylallyltransferase MiaA [Pigmentiphaga sp.]
MGPTASGKSAAARALASRWPVEIINVDSATIYRGMDIGTAKPDANERARLVHHLLDIRDPAESYSVADFRRDALGLVAQAHRRERLPVLAGGTMMYFHVLQAGLADLPAANAALRQELEDRAATLGWPALHAELARLDPATATRLAPNDSQRIQRALEVCLLSGRPFSAHLAQAAGPPRDLEGLHFVELSLEPADRGVLHQRIAQRFDLMLEAGLVAEVAGLRARGDLHPGLPSVRCVGYRQLWPHVGGELSLAMAREQAIAATRQLAKRQLTWLRGRPARRQLDCLRADVATQVVDAAYTALASLRASSS